MVNTRTFQRSFAGGEVSPEMFGRIDDTHFQSGAAKIRNFIVRPQGPAQMRPGLQFVRATKTASRKARLIPFSYSPTDTLVIELGSRGASATNGYFRFHTLGGTLTTTASAYSATQPYAIGDLASYLGVDYYCIQAGTGQTPSTSPLYWYPQPIENGLNIFEIPNNYDYSTTDYFDIHYVQSGDVLTLVHPNYPPMELRRYDAVRWVFSQISFAPKLPAPTWAGVPYIASYGNRVNIVSMGIWNMQTGDMRPVITTPSLHGVVENDTFYIQNTGCTLFDGKPFARYGNSADTYISIKSTDGYGVVYADWRLNNLSSFSGSATFIGAGSPNINFSGHIFIDGDTVTFSGTTPSPIVAGTTYYVRDSNISVGTFRVASTLGGAAINVTGSTSTNTVTLSATSLLKVFYLSAWATPSTPVAHNLTLNCRCGYNAHNSPIVGPYYAQPASNLYFRFATTPSGTTYYVWPGSAVIVCLQLQPLNGMCQLSNLSSDLQQSYKVTAVDEYGSESLASTELTITNNLYANGSKNQIVWNGVTGAVRYNVYKKQSGLFGYVGQSEETTFTDDNIAPDMGTTIPLVDSGLSNQYNYPAAVSYFEQRRCFAGTTNGPQSIWMTRSGTESNLSYAIPVKDSDRIFFKVSAREANTIRHIVPLNQLILLTNAAEWRVTSINSDALTPSTVAVRPQSYVGANNVQPCVVNNTLVYCANRGGHVRELGYNWQAQSYITGDLSIRAGHLFDGYTIKDMAYAKAPNPVLWFVSSTGSLLGLTYIPEEQVGAWHQHDTGGDAIESCAVVSEGDEDRLYVIVARQIGGTTVRYVERMAAMSFSSIATSFFVDSGLTSTNANPVTTVSGLDHLNGRTVNVLADGKVQSQKVVANGSITLDSAASTVTVGLPIVADLQTLPVAMQVDGYGQGRYKNINKAWLRLYRSSGISIGPDTNNLVPFDPYETTPTLKSDEIQVLLTPSWAASGQVYIRQTNPLPLSVVGLTLEVAVGG